MDAKNKQKAPLSTAKTRKIHVAKLGYVCTPYSFHNQACRMDFSRARTLSGRLPPQNGRFLT